MLKISRKLAINGSMLDDHPTGVGIYSIHVINHLASLYRRENRETITVFTPAWKELDGYSKIVRLSPFLKSSRYGKFAAISRFFWNTVLYPIQARNFESYLSPTTHGNFSLGGQFITIHDLLSLRFNNISFHQRFYFKYLLPRLVKRAKKIIAVSETTKRDIVHFLNCPENKITVIHNGYDETLYNTDIINNKTFSETYPIKNYFLAIGPTYAHKNFDLLIDAYASLPGYIKEKHTLVIAGGRTEYLTHLKNKVQHMQPGGKIIFLGYVAKELMPSLYKECYLLIFPSLFEGFGFPLLEAMACGRPVLASNTSSMPEVCGDAALYFDPHSRQSLEDAIIKIHNDKNLYDAFIKKGLLRVKEFSWSKTARTLKNLIEEGDTKI